VNKRLLAVATAILILLLLPLGFDIPNPKEIVEAKRQEQLNSKIKEFLINKDSPLAQETDFLLDQRHWKLLIAISAIESQYCKRQIAYNCWGIGGDSAYRHYSSLREAIIDADALITKWQERGRWLTIEDMNCHYVVPCNPNWVRVVNSNLDELDSYERDVK